MKASIECCGYFENMSWHFDWFSYSDDDGNKVRVMPILKSIDGKVRARVNYCPSCGEKIRSIELRND